MKEKTKGFIEGFVAAPLVALAGYAVYKTIKPDYLKDYEEDDDFDDFEDIDDLDDFEDIDDEEYVKEFEKHLEKTYAYGPDETEDHKEELKETEEKTE